MFRPVFTGVNIRAITEMSQRVFMRAEFRFLLNTDCFTNQLRIHFVYFYAFANGFQQHDRQLTAEVFPELIQPFQ